MSGFSLFIDPDNWQHPDSPELHWLNAHLHYGSLKSIRGQAAMQFANSGVPGNPAPQLASGVLFALIDKK